MSMHDRIPGLFLAFAFLALGLVSGVGPGAAAAEVHVVQMTSVDFQPQFLPADLTIRPGDTVRWVNVDPTLIDHSTCSGTGSSDPEKGEYWNSGAVPSGAFFEITFDQTGEFEYFSVLHEYENANGIVRVSNGSTSADGRIEDTTWGRIKRQFAEILPRE